MQMERQENPFLVKPIPPLGTFGILREALKTTCRNGRLSAVTLLLMYFSVSQLEFGAKLALTPVLKDLSSHWPVCKIAIMSFPSRASGEFRYANMPRLAHEKSYIFVNEVTETGSIQHMHSLPQTNQDVFPAIGYMHQTVRNGGLKDVRSLLELELIVLAICCVILLFVLVAAISSSYEAYTAKVILTLKDVFLTFRGSWIRPIHTGFWLSLISFGLLGLLGILIGLVSIFTEGSSAYLLYALLFVSSSFWYFHMAALWILSLVVSVIERDASGLKAIDRAGDLMKGKKIQAYVLMFLFDFATGAVHMIASAYARKLDKWAKIAITVPFMMELICIFKLFMIVVFVIYYHERKMSRKEEAEGKMRLISVSIASGDEV